MNMKRNRKERREPVSHYRAMWLFTLYDLPVTDAEYRREYQKFHKFLLSKGFVMFQFSVYARFCGSGEYLEIIKHSIKDNLPKEGQVRLFQMTDRQYILQDIFIGKSRQDSEEKPEQLLLF